MLEFCNCYDDTCTVGFEEILTSSFLPNGGIYMPKNLPHLSQDRLKNWQNLSYPDLMKEFLQFILNDNDDYKDMTILESIVQNAYKDFDNYPNNIVPIQKLSDENVFVAEFYHGPSMSFKDYTMFSVTQLMENSLKKQNKSMKALIATSGDTGSAAIYAVRDKQNIEVYVMYPLGRISQIQELQMTTATSKNVFVIGAQQTSDDFDGIMKNLFMDKEFCEHHPLTTLNSINMTRVLLQTVHFIYIYLQMKTLCPEDNQQHIRIVVPSGGLGNIVGGCLARSIGVPIDLIIACNQNSVVHDFIQTGTISIPKEVKCSLSCSMDITVPANLPRLLWLFSNQNTSLVQKLMSDLECNGSVQIPNQLHKNIREAIVHSISVEESECLQVITDTWENFQYPICPHTACGLAYARLCKKTSTSPLCVIATASPNKFPEALHKANVNLPKFPQLENLMNAKKNVLIVSPQDNVELILRNLIIESSSNKLQQ